MVSMAIISCNKENTVATENNNHEILPDTPKPFLQYVIPMGQQYSHLSGYQKISYDTLSFIVRFDSSAIYTTTDPANQDDINKLYGFSDNNSPHHDYSARFGWRWSNHALRLFAYVYNQGQLSSRELGSIRIGDENFCKIIVQGNQYIFLCNSILATMPRKSITVKAEGYKLFPYFGGNETAPHAISIWIKEL